MHRDDLRDLALAIDHDFLRNLFFVPALGKAGPRPRGKNARAAVAVHKFRMVASRLSMELRHDEELANRVRSFANKRGEGDVLLPSTGSGIVELVAYMLDTRWGSLFEKLGLRKPLDDLEEFRKKYLPRKSPPEDEWRFTRMRVLPIFDRTVLFFDPDYLKRLLKRHPIGSLDED